MNLGVEREVSVFYYGQSNRPVQCVDIIGIVRAIDIFKKAIKYYSKYFCAIFFSAFSY
jgi:hypothetical protein